MVDGSPQIVKSSGGLVMSGRESTHNFAIDVFGVEGTHRPPSCGFDHCRGIAWDEFEEESRYSKAARPALGLDGRSLVVLAPQRSGHSLWNKQAEEIVKKGTYLG